MLTRMFDPAAAEQNEAWRILATLLSGATLQLALPAAVTANGALNLCSLGGMWLLFDAMNCTCRGARAKLLEGLRGKARRLDSRLEVSDSMAFSSPHVQAAFEGWQGHRVLDWVPNLVTTVTMVGAAIPDLARLGHRITAQRAGVLVKLMRRREICPLSVHVTHLLFLTLYTCRSVPVIWQQLSLAHRSWISIVIGHAGLLYGVVKLLHGDKCYASLFPAAMISLPGILIMLAVLSVVSYIGHSAAVAHTETHYGMLTAEYTALLMVQRLRRTGLQLSESEDMQRELAALVIFAVVLSQLGCTGRHAVAAYTRSMFLASGSSQR
eukprot:jgi/Tetstr1/440029/TSEL_028390.t1